MSPVRLLYTLAFYGALPFILPYLARKKRLNRQCFGFVPPMTKSDAPLVWLHAVSVGEAAAAAELIRHLHAHHCRLVLTHTTAAGGDRLRQHHGDYAQIHQLPLDLPGAMRRFVRRVQPTLAIMMEAEYWPNMLAATKNADTVLLLANARLTAAAARKYAKCAPLMREMLASFDAAAAQTRADAKRLAFFGMRQITVAGNLKFDRPTDEKQAAQGATWRQTWRATKPILLIAGSRPGEESLLLNAMDDDFWRKFFVIFAPRHRERGDAVAALLTAKNINFGRRANGDEPNPAQTEAYLADTLGEMDAFYTCCDAAIICGSFLPFGGQNPIEAMLCGTAAIIGPHVANYRTLVAQARQQGALQQAADADDALQRAANLVAANEVKQNQERAAAQFCIGRRGALVAHENLAMQLLTVAAQRRKNKSA